MSSVILVGQTSIPTCGYALQEQEALHEQLFQIQEGTLRGHICTLQKTLEMLELSQVWSSCSTEIKDIVETSRIRGIILQFLVRVRISSKTAKFENVVGIIEADAVGNLASQLHLDKV